MRTITHRDGKAYVADTRILYTEPVELTAYYRLLGDIPVGAVAGSDYMSVGCEVYVDGRKIGFARYEHGKETVATWTEDKAIAPPKVRKGTQVRWNGGQGYWEKLSKREGWVQA